MKNIIEIFKSDIKRLKTKKAALVVIIGILIIPGIYAWLNIDSNWSPYDNTGNLPIAIVNKDVGTVVFDKELNIGELLEEKLKSNNLMKWIFSNDVEYAKEMVNRSEYYGLIVIPEEFSNSLITILEDTGIKKPKLDFYVNQKKNPVAPIIVNKVADTLQSTINQTFVNTIVYKIVDTLDDASFITKTAETKLELNEKLDFIKNEAIKLKAIMNTLSLASDSSAKSLLALNDILPDIKNIAVNTKEEMANVKDSLDSFNSTYDNLINEIDNIFALVDEIIKDIDNILTVQDDKINIEKSFEDINKKLSAISDSLLNLDNSLKTIQNTFDIPLIASLREKINNVQNEINDIKEFINNSKKTTSDVKELKIKLNALSNSFTDAYKLYKNSVKPSLVESFAEIKESLAKINSLSNSLGNSIKGTDSATNNIVGVLNNTKELTSSIEVIIDGFIEDIDKLKELVESEKAEDMYVKLVNILENSPDVVADFITSPVETNKIDIYGVESYGSQMAPFYTILATWVGCTLLVAIIKVDIKVKNNKNIKNYEVFFGRFMLFGVLAMLQGLVIGIGDIILQVQILNIPLFLLTTMLSSLVFMLIVYSLTVSLGKVGEAIAVIIMVLQVAGSGGTFPIELLPRFFQVLQPFMPFYPAMNALRETIGGFYSNDYIIYILMLLCHTIIPITLGLLLRKILKPVKDKLEEELEETDILI